MEEKLQLEKQFNKGIKFVAIVSMLLAFVGYPLFISAGVPILGLFNVIMGFFVAYCYVKRDINISDYRAVIYMPEKRLEVGKVIMEIVIIMYVKIMVTAVLTHSMDKMLFWFSCVFLAVEYILLLSYRNQFAEIQEKFLQYINILGKKKSIRTSSISKLYYNNIRKRYFIYNSKKEKLFSFRKNMINADIFLQELVQIISSNRAKKEGFIMELTLEEILEKEKPISNSYLKNIKLATVIWTTYNLLFYIVIGMLAFKNNNISIENYAMLICVPMLNMYAFALLFSDVVSWMEPGRGSASKNKQWNKKHVFYFFPFMLVSLGYMILFSPIINVFSNMIKGEMVPYMIGFLMALIIFLLILLRSGVNKNRTAEYIIIGFTTLFVGFFMAHSVIIASDNSHYSYEAKIEKSYEADDDYYVIVDLKKEKDYKLEVSKDVYYSNKTGDLITIVHYEGIFDTEWVRAFD